MSNTFKERLEQALIIRKIKASDLAEKTGINKARISQYVNGIYTPKSKATYIIAQALNVDEKWLMGFDVPMEKSEIINHQPAPLITKDEQELLTIYRNVNQDGQDYIMQTARMVGDTERYQKPDIRLKASRSADDHGAEYVEVTPEERKRLDEAPDETQNPDNDL